MHVHGAGPYVTRTRAGVDAASVPAIAGPSIPARGLLGAAHPSPVDRRVATESVQLASRVAFAPIWFLGVCVLVIALVPLTWELHRRFEWRAVIACVVAAVVVDTVVRAGTSVATLTVYLWHMPAMILTAALTYMTGLWPHTSQIDAAWWELRPLWLILCTLLLAILVFLFRHFEGTVPVSRSAPVRTLIGLTATLAGITWLVQRGLYAPETSPLLSAVGIGMLFGGLAALGALRLRPLSVRQR